jgi:dihydrofolate reductase
MRHSGAPANRTVFCIGGAVLYGEALPLASLLHLTQIERDFPGDAFFPPYDRREWREESRETHQVDGPEGFQYHFAVYRRARPGEE